MPLTSFPGNLDSFPVINGVEKQSVLPHSKVHNLAHEALAALEVKVGKDNSNDVSSIDYKLRTSTHTHISGEVPAGLINGINVSFMLASPPNPAGSFMLFVNGLLQRPVGNDFTLTGSTITFVTAPSASDGLVAHYIL